MAKCLQTLVLLLLTAAATASGRYTPEELFDYEVVKFDNGLEAILNPRGTAKNVSLRIIVGVGHQDFSCEDSELPHFAEHLLYSGTSQSSESELEGTIKNWGGVWNAFTYGDRTVYELDIYSANFQDAVRLHYEMFTDVALTDATVDTAREVIHAESGGTPSGVRAFLYRNGITTNSAGHAYRQFVPGTRAFCESTPSAEHIDRNMVLEFLDYYYIPANMAIIAVGDFDRDELVEILAQTFGSLSNPRSVRKDKPVPELPSHGMEYHTTLNPFFGNESYVSLEVQVPREFSTEKLALLLLGEYMEAELYRELRIERGWSYTPGVTINNYLDFGVLFLGAEVPTDRAEETFKVFEELIGRVREKGIPNDELETIRNGILLSDVSSYEANSQFAGFYVDFIDYYWRDGEFLDWEDGLLSVDTTMTQAAAVQYLVTDQAMYYYSEPTLTYTGLGIAASSTLIAPVSLVFFWRRKRLTREHAPKNQQCQSADRHAKGPQAIGVRKRPMGDSRAL